MMYILVNNNNLDSFSLSLSVRYQPVQPSVNVHYQIASCQEETEADSINESSAGFIPGSQDLFTPGNLLFPRNEEPSRLSGFTVNICTSVLGQTHTDAYLTYLLK